MHPNTVVLEISSDEEDDWNDHDGGGIADGGDDHNWLAELLVEVNKVNYGDDSGEVVLVSEVSPSEKSGKKSKLKSFSIDLDDDCMVLDNDPDKPVEVRNDNPSSGNDDSDDVLLVSEKGQVACRDYPHPRHLCIKFRFSATPNQSHCDQCYCYVCDSPAPCVYWGNGSASTDHCHATDKDEFWRLERKNANNGSKGVQPVPKVVDASLTNRLPPLNLYRPAMALVQPHNQIPRASSIHMHHTSANFGSPNIINQNKSPICASRNKLRPDFVSQLLLRTNGARGHHNYSLGTQVHRPVFKRTGSVAAATTANRHSYGSYRGNFGNPSRQQNYHVNGMLSVPNKYLGSLQPNAVNTSGSYPPQSQSYTSSTVNPLFDQPLPSQPQFSNHSKPKFQSQVNSNLFLENPVLYQPHLVPSSSQPQLASCQPSYPVPSQPSYHVPSQPSYPVPSQTRVDSLSVPVSDHTQNVPLGNQAQSPTIDPGFKDYGFSWPPSDASQHSATLDGAAPTNESSLAAVSGSLADYRYDWIFDNQPVEPGFMDVPGPYGLNEFSSDFAFIDTGPIFDF